jgi:hypothetical protein
MVDLVVVVVAVAWPQVVVVGIVVVVPVIGRVTKTVEVVVPIIMVPLRQIHPIAITVMVR